MLCRVCRGRRTRRLPAWTTDHRTALNTMACRRAAAVACRTDIFDISRCMQFQVRSTAASAGVELPDGCGFGAVGLTGMGLGGRLKFSLAVVRH